MTISTLLSTKYFTGCPESIGSIVSLISDEHFCELQSDTWEEENQCDNPLLSTIEIDFNTLDWAEAVDLPWIYEDQTLTVKRDISEAGWAKAADLPIFLYRFISKGTMPVTVVMSDYYTHLGYAEAINIPGATYEAIYDGLPF